MKKLFYLTAFFVLFTFGKSTEARTYTEVSFNFFYSSLSHHGEWIELDRGFIVWRPAFVHRNWRPYSDGRWIWTRYGWYWDSHEPFGWATYHYGRWFYDDYYGWVWLPDYEWAPAWVEWRYSDSYIGWAPLPPYASFRIGVGIHFSINWNAHYNYWNFVSYPHFTRDRINIYIINERYYDNFFSRTKYRTNYRYDRGMIINDGIDRNFVERKSGYRFAERNVSWTDDYDSYKNRDLSNAREIRAYRPSENDRKHSETLDRSKLLKADRGTSLKTEKVEINRLAEKRNDSRANESRNGILRNDSRDMNEGANKTGRNVKPNNSDEKKSESKRAAPIREESILRESGSEHTSIKIKKVETAGKEARKIESKKSPKKSETQKRSNDIKISSKKDDSGKREVNKTTKKVEKRKPAER